MSNKVGPTSIEERLENLEKQNRRLRSTVTMFALCLAAVVLLGAAAQTGAFTTITAERIEIVDQDGNQVITLGSGDIGTGIAVYQSDGSIAAIFGMSNAEQAGSLALFDDEGRGRLGMGMDDGVPSMAIANANGKKLISIGGTDERYGMAIRDAEEKERAGIGVVRSQPVCFLSDVDGKAKIGMEQVQSGPYRFVMVDDNGIRAVLDDVD